jgi:hypothetical protein
MKIIPFVPLVLCLATGCGSAAAEPDKSGYNLFNPVPDALLRDLDTDRPDKSNSPHTLDAGHYQLESGLFTYTRTTAAGVRTQNASWADTTLRAGLTPWAEVQLELPVYQANRTTDLATHETQRASGAGDLTAILKGNLWGNDSGDTAGGVELWVKTPTANHNLGNGKVEGGMVFLLGMKLPGDFDLGINDGIGISVNDNNVYHADIINSISLSHAIAGPLSAYVEFYSSVPTQASGDWVGTVDTGLLLQIGKNFQVDCGINMGVTSGADDWQPFVGASCRF